MGRVTTTREGGAAVITYASPPLGTLTAEGAQELLDAVRAAGADPEVRALVITGGQPGIFIRHYDVGELSGIATVLRNRPPPTAAGESAYASLVDAIFALPKPVIAAIDGLCMGGGFELALACDLRIAGPAATAIGLPETRIGIFPGGGGTQRLPRVVGEAKALEIILRGLTFAAEEAHRIGLVHEFVTNARTRALELAAEFAARPPEGLAAAKRLTRAALDRLIADGLADERRTFIEVMRTASAGAALDSFARGAASLNEV
jgi:enoyl-CoA hydratase/carnithine racemase